MSKKLKANAVQDNQQAKQFVDVVLEYLRIGEGNPEVDGDTVQFPARVGEREFEVHCWFESAASRAHIMIFFYDVFPPTLVHEVAAFMKPVLAVPTNVGGQLKISVTGHVKWMSYCQLNPDDAIDLALVRELVAVGITESNRLVYQIAAFAAGRNSGESAEIPAWARPFMNGQFSKDEPMN